MDLFHYVAAAAQGWAVVETTAVKQPAVGTDWSLTVPGGKAWQLLYVHGQLVTSAVVANRLPILTIDNGSGELVQTRMALRSVITATTTAQCEWQRFASDAAVTVSNVFYGHIPESVLPGGTRLIMATQAIDVGDQWSGIVVTALEADVQLYAQREATALDALVGTPPTDSRPFAPYTYPYR